MTCSFWCEFERREGRRERLCSLLIVCIYVLFSCLCVHACVDEHVHVCMHMVMLTVLRNPRSFYVVRCWFICLPTIFLCVFLSCLLGLKKKKKMFV